eukprot:gnl/TRDRNA2_/TRDRNA2_177227_c0_seq1.p1 gnl/TRDRNA2_/TRDRNA2_177227_c0~~gnl/TRDRNA2_/TRDRNA2_177227_c0_seq1.p1  ORF type:complete len:310 (-),score=-27.61 gnl/TRDRNA2_/TRDRNA2_177227_c0_seq1:402-1331(-)
MLFSVKKNTDTETEDSEEEKCLFDAESIRIHKEVTKVKSISKIFLHRFEMDTWYFSPFPKEFRNCSKVYFCPFTLEYFKSMEQMIQHSNESALYHPPGIQIYQKGSMRVFEVEASKEVRYCQNLSLLAKLFLDHKTLFWDLNPFLFYILCECDKLGCHIVGYFSKERSSWQNNNLACLLTLPCYQKKGYGKFLLEFSYELSKFEEKVGTPERPLSDLGLRSYLHYWIFVILCFFKNRFTRSITIEKLSKLTKISECDILYALNYYSLINYKNGYIMISMDPKFVKMVLDNYDYTGPNIDSHKFIWSYNN